MVLHLAIANSQVVQVANSLPADAGVLRDAGSIPGSRRSFGRGHGNPFQYSCLENPMDRGAWQASVHRVTEWERTEVTEYTQVSDQV